MQEFIQQAMKALGTSEDTTKAATGGLLSFLETNGPKADVGKLFDALPGARDLIASAKPGAAAAGGVLPSISVLQPAVVERRSNRTQLFLAGSVVRCWSAARPTPLSVG